MPSLIVLFGSLLVTLPLFAQSGQKITLLISDPFGSPVREWTVAKFRDERGRDWKKSFRDGSAQVPPGTYTVSISAGKREMGFDGQIEVRWQKETYPIGLSFGAMEGGTLSTTIQGRLKAVPGKDIECRLNAIYLNEQFVTTVQTDGSFSFQRVPLGTYSLFCGTSGAILFNRIVDIRTLTDIRLVGDFSSDVTLEIPKR